MHQLVFKKCNSQNEEEDTAGNTAEVEDAVEFEDTAEEDDTAGPLQDTAAEVGLQSQGTAEVGLQSQGETAEGQQYAGLGEVEVLAHQHREQYQQELWNTSSQSNMEQR